jgi:hypothetical protein
MSRALVSLFGASPGAIAESLLFALAFSFLGYRMSVRHRAARGVTPWRLPSPVWAVICLVFQFMGIALEILAELTTRPALPAAAPPKPSLGAYSYPYAPPVVGTRATTGTGAGGEVDESVPTGFPPPAGDGEGRAALFGWYPDPTGRHASRYFDGRQWSDLVSDGGVASNDPLD